jgi:hypothetical protein
VSTIQTVAENSEAYTAKQERLYADNLASALASADIDAWEDRLLDDYLEGIS